MAFHWWTYSGPRLYRSSCPTKGCDPPTKPSLENMCLGMLAGILLKPELRRMLFPVFLSDYFLLFWPWLCFIVHYNGSVWMGLKRENRYLTQQRLRTRLDRWSEGMNYEDTAGVAFKWAPVFGVSENARLKPSPQLHKLARKLKFRL